MNNHPVGLSKTELLSGFMVKVLMGIVYGWVFLHYFHGDDTWEINRLSLTETQLLLHNPAEFFKAYFPLYILDPAFGDPNPVSHFLAFLEYALLIKTLAFVNLLSQGNYYVNSIFFNGIVFWGHYWLFNLFNSLYPEKRKWLYCAIFLFLPAMFWLSGIRSDGLLFFFTALLLVNLCRPFRRGSFWYILAGFAGMFIIRMEFALLLALGMIAYILCKKTRFSGLLVFSVVYGLALLLFFGELSLGSGKIAGQVIERQRLFLLLKGTAFPLTPLQPSLISFLKVLPEAVNNTVCRPYIWETRTGLQLLYALETLFFLALLVLAVLFRHRNWKQRMQSPVLLLLLFYSVSVYILVGYTVPFPGAIVRYKCMPELMMLCLLVAITDYHVILNKIITFVFPQKTPKK